MRFLSCKDPAGRRVLLGLVVCMLFGLFGCSRSLTPEETARRHLEKKYGGSFVVGELTKKENGPFMTADYSGDVHETGRPLESFTVWVSGDCTEVGDARYTVALLPAINAWVQDQADGVWDDVKTAVVVKALSYNSRPDYGTEDFMAFYQNETVHNTVLLAVPSDDDPVEHMLRFQDSLRDVMTGYILVYRTDTEDMASLLGQTPDAEIMIGSPESVIRKKLEGK